MKKCHCTGLLEYIWELQEPSNRGSAASRPLPQGAQPPAPCPLPQGAQPWALPQGVWFLFSTVG